MDGVCSQLKIPKSNSFRGTVAKEKRPGGVSLRFGEQRAGRSRWQAAGAVLPVGLEGDSGRAGTGGD